MNFVGNYYVMGPNSQFVHSLNHYVDTRVYAHGNIGPKRTSLDQNEFVGVVWRGPKERQGLKAKERFDAAPPVTVQRYDKAYELVLAQAGATLPKRDAVDRRIVQEVRDRAGRIIDHPTEVGGWPELASAPPPKDDDQDGMPDEWERQNRLDPADPNDHREDPDGDGYTNIEEWLNNANPRTAD